MKKLTVLIPCYNEERGIGNVISEIPVVNFRKLGIKTEVIVIDNNSRDRTAAIAKSLGAKVITEKKQGKGYAIQTGFRKVPKDSDYVVMLDGDNTYKSSEMLRLVEPIYSGFCDVVIGSRLGGKMVNGSMGASNRMGNWIFTFLVRYVNQANVTDVCTGYFAWKGKVVRELAKSITSPGFSLEMEMVTKMAKLNYEIFSVPITYEMREEESHLRPFQDGAVIFRTWLKSVLILL